MEKKGDVLNQLAIISDLLENVNMEVNETSIAFNLKKEEFNRMYNTIYLKAKDKNVKPPKDTFQVKIGSIMIIFNTNNA